MKDFDGTAVGRLKRTAGRRDRKVIDHHALRRLQMLRPPQQESDEDRFLNDLVEDIAQDPDA